MTLTRYGLNGTGGTAVGLSGVLSAIDNRIEFNFGDQGIGGNRNSNLGDGYYEIALDLDDNGTFETTRHFYRLLGDVNGDRTVSSADAYAILYAYGQTGSNLDQDANGDGYVNALDRVLAMRAVGRSLASGLPLDD
jgi:cyanate lyase